MRGYLIALLVIGALAQNGIDAQVLSKIQAIQASQLGKTLFDTVQVQLSNSEPLDRLIDTLSNLENQYQQDQKEDDANNKNFQSQCDGDIDVLDKDIAEQNRKKVEIQGVIDELKPVLSQRQATLGAKNEFKKGLVKEINEVDATRQQEAEEFETKRQEMQLVVAVIQEAKRIFETSFSSSFLQEKKSTTPVQPEVMTQINQHFTKVATQTGKQKFGKTFSHIFRFLAQMTSSNKTANSGLVQKIIHLCEQLLDKVDEAWTLERKAEDERIRVYSAYKTLLTKDLNQYNSQIANLETEIASLTDRLSNATNNLNDVQQRIDDKTTRKSDRSGECNEAAYDYAQRRQARDGDRDTVSQLIGIIHANLRDLKQYIALRVAAGDTRLG